MIANNPHEHPLNSLTPKLGGGVLLNITLMDQFTENCYLSRLLAVKNFCRNAQLKAWRLKSGSNLKWMWDFNALYSLFQQTPSLHSGNVWSKSHNYGSISDFELQRARDWKTKSLGFVLQVMFDDSRWDGTVVTLPACLCVISEQTTLSPVCREASSRRLRKGPRKRGQSARHFLLTAQEPGDDTPSSRSTRRCHVCMPGCTWVHLRWRRRRQSGRRPSITSVGISDFWLQWWQDRWCRESDRGIQTALRDVSVHGAAEEQPHNKPAIITPSGHPARAWREAKPCRGAPTRLQSFY